MQSLAQTRSPYPLPIRLLNGSAVATLRRLRGSPHEWIAQSLTAATPTA